MMRNAMNRVNRLRPRDISRRPAAIGGRVTWLEPGGRR